MAKTQHPTAERMDRYLQGMLKGSARDAVERHFMACDACFAYVRERLGAELVGAGTHRERDNTRRPPD